MLIVQTLQLTKNYGKIAAVDNLNISIEEGKYLVYWDPMALAKQP